MFIFQSTLPRGSDGILQGYLHWCIKFQSTLPRGERLLDSFIISSVFLFQSTLPRGERPLLGNAVSSLNKFQSTLPRGERLARPKLRCYTPNFNPRSRVGSDVPAVVAHHKKTVISIHAPAWGATECAAGYADYVVISIHAPAWGATWYHE